MWERKFPHCAWPMVWAPERAVMSRALRPLAANEDMRVERPEEGPGRSSGARLLSPPVGGQFRLRRAAKVELTLASS
ncbi:unnamed protein product [Musa acuminata subsp. burmannicoides]